MGILSSALTVSRFRVLDPTLPEGWREIYRDRLNEFAFHEPPQGMGKEEGEGWCQIKNLLDTEFDDFNEWLYNGWAVFQLRVDKKRLPMKLFKATLEKRGKAWCEEHEVERCPSTVKTELKERLEHEWMVRMLPSSRVTEAAWNMEDGYVIVHTLSEGSVDAFRKRFFRTFGKKLAPWSPLDWLEDAKTVENLLATGAEPVVSLEDAAPLESVALDDGDEK
ncbi:MAG: recombination-associated protein RdgC [Rhodobacterales bacterium]|nr:recombination-associated protein RdgC [Rhodobacterales bacterium]